MKEFALRLAVLLLRGLAALTGLCVKKRDGIVLISCQSDEPSQDMLDLAAAIGARPGSPSVYVLAGRMRRSFGGAVRFFGRLNKMLRAIAGAAVVVIDAYCPAVSIPKKRSGQKVVQIWHAPEAIKKFSRQVLDTPAGYESGTAGILCMHRNYDYILCPSDATRPFFEEAFGYPESAFVKLGQPSLDRIGRMKRRAETPEKESEERGAARETIFKEYPELVPKEGKRALIVVYAPTFRDGAAVDAAGLVRALAQAKAGESFSDLWSGVALVLKPHPHDSVRPNAARQGNVQEMIADRSIALIDWYAVADVIVTDYSGVAVDAAVSGVASYYYIYDINEYKAKRGINVDLRDEAVGEYAYTDADELAARVFCDFEKGSPAYDYEALDSFARKYLELPLSGNTERLAAFISDLSEKTH